MAILKLYNDIQTENEKKMCSWWGEAEGVCFKDVDEFIEQMDEDDNMIDLRIFCDGGSVMEGWAMYDKLRATGKEITATVEGKAASMATVIMMAAPKERRKAYKSAQVCVHNPWVPGYALGDQMTADDLQKAADDLMAQQERILDLYVERCGCDREQMQALMNEDKYIDADEAKALGIIGEIIAPASAKKNGAMFNQQNISKMAKDKEEKVEVRASLMQRILAKLGIENAEDLEQEDVKGMDLATADGGTLTVEREEGNPQVGDKASPDGEHEMPDGSTIVVADGAIAEIKPKDGEGSKDDDEKDAKIQSLEAEVADLKSRLEKAEANAKSVEDLRILNAVKIAGGEKALAKLASDYKPAGRKVDGGHAASAAEDAEMSPMRAEIEARRNGTFKREKK